MSHAHQPQEQHGHQPYPPQPYPGQMVPQRPMPTASPKSPGVAALLSLIIPGLGHLYTGNPISAIFWFVSTAVSAMLITLLVGVVLLPLVWLGAIIHAYVSAGNFNRRHHAIR